MGSLPAASQDILPRESGIRLQNVFDAVARGQKLKDRPHGDACAAHYRLSVADIGIYDDAVHEEGKI